jgi:hypothetical protein
VAAHGHAHGAEHPVRPHDGRGSAVDPRAPAGGEGSGHGEPAGLIRLCLHGEHVGPGRGDAHRGLEPRCRLVRAFGFDEELRRRVHRARGDQVHRGSSGDVARAADERDRRRRRGNAEEPDGIRKHGRELPDLDQTGRSAAVERHHVGDAAHLQEPQSDGVFAALLHHAREPVRRDRSHAGEVGIVAAAEAPTAADGRIQGLLQSEGVAPLRPPAGRAAHQAPIQGRQGRRRGEHAVRAGLRRDGLHHRRDVGQELARGHLVHGQAGHREVAHRKEPEQRGQRGVRTLGEAAPGREQRRHRAQGRGHLELRGERLVRGRPPSGRRGERCAQRLGMGHQETGQGHRAQRHDDRRHGHHARAPPLPR